jgi:hypothetical protein
MIRGVVLPDYMRIGANAPNERIPLARLYFRKEECEGNQENLQHLVS